MTTRLIAQHEGPCDEIGRSYGFEVLHDPAEGFYTIKFHIRTYDGIRVADKWNTPEMTMQATTGQGAIAEAQRCLVEFVALLNPVGV